MREIYWQYSKDTPAFFRDSLLQFVARTYYLTRDNFDGSKSQAWTAGGWVAYRSGLIGDMFGVHAAGYTSQPIFAPVDEGGTKLLTPIAKFDRVIGQLYGRMQIGDQEIRGGRQLVDTPLINPQDNRMVPNTFEGATLVSLPDKDRSYDYSVGYLWGIKQRDANGFIPMSDALAGGMPTMARPLEWSNIGRLPDSRWQPWTTTSRTSSTRHLPRPNMISASPRGFQTGSSGQI